MTSTSIAPIRPMQRQLFRNVPGWAIVTAWTVVVAIPLYIFASSCFKSTSDIFASPLAMPKEWSFVNFENAWVNAKFSRYLFNSFIVTIFSVAATIILAVLASYPLSRLELGWGKWALGIFLLGIMLPVRLASAEMFDVLKAFNLLDSRLGLIIVFVAIRLPFAMLILSNFMRAIPRDIEEAAKIDGASNLNILMRIFVPQLRPAIGVVAIFTGIAVWNDFYFPLIFIFSDENQVLPVAIAGLSGQYNTDWGALFAGLAISVLPLAGLYIIASRQVQQAMGKGAFR